MLPQSIISKILAKYGKDEVYSADCAPLAGQIGIGETTVKRMLGLVGENSPERRRTPHVSTMDLLAKWLGYDNYKSLLREIGEQNYASEFTSIEMIDVRELGEGTQQQIKYDPDRVIVMTYLGNCIFMVNESINSRLHKGDRIKVYYLVLGERMIVKERIRAERSLGGYYCGKDGGLTSIEVIA